MQAEQTKKRKKWPIVLLVVVLVVIAVIVVQESKKYRLLQEYLDCAKTIEQELDDAVISNVKEYMSVKLSDFKITDVLEKEIKAGKTDEYFKYYYKDYVVTISSNLFLNLSKEEQYDLLDAIYDVSDATEYYSDDGKDYAISLISNCSAKIVAGGNEYTSGAFTLYKDGIEYYDAVNARREFQENVVDKMIDDDRKWYAVSVAQKMVKDRLKSPSSASFSYDLEEYTIMRDGDEYSVSSYVEADNSFGAKLKQNFTVKFERLSDTKYKEISAIIG